MYSGTSLLKSEISWEKGALSYIHWVSSTKKVFDEYVGPEEITEITDLGVQFTPGS
jgi:hypothetical protein